VTDTPRRRRKLAAILMADVVGFSKMMGRDEEGTTSRIIEFHDCVKREVERHGGRVVGTAGDSVFGDFESIVEALESATEIQRWLHAENVGRPFEERIDARIGLHLGDVIVEEYNIFGDGVNIAARLEQMADPGGILLSEAVYQQVKGHLDLPIEEIGIRTLKNIDQPIRLYRIGPEALGGVPDGAAASPPEMSTLGRTLRDAIVRDESPTWEAGPAVESAGTVGGGGAGAIFNPGTLAITAAGVLGVLALSTGWTENDWYPFLGVYFLGVVAGRVVGGLSRRPGLSALIKAMGLAVAAFFFDKAAMRAVLWVLAAAMVGGAIQRLRTNPRETGVPNGS
jgi:class 3 adenylate cyclase